LQDDKRYRLCAINSPGKEKAGVSQVAIIAVKPLPAIINTTALLPVGGIKRLKTIFRTAMVTTPTSAEIFSS